jgi:DNA polymerase III delta subunit
MLIIIKLTECTVNLKWLRNFATGQVAEVKTCWSLRELQETLVWSNSTQKSISIHVDAFEHLVLLVPTPGYVTYSDLAVVDLTTSEAKALTAEAYIKLAYKIYILR